MSSNVPVEETVKKIIAKIIRRPDLDLSPGLSFKDMKADSLDVVQILVAIEDTYGIELKDEDIRVIPNIGEFIKFIEQKVASKAK
jgi:acyl carrier protein